jgi:hypothetical protein
MGKKQLGSVEPLPSLGNGDRERMASACKWRKPLLQSLPSLPVLGREAEGSAKDRQPRFRKAFKMTDKKIQAAITLLGYDTETRTAMTEESKRDGCIRLTKCFQDSGWLHTWTEALSYAKRKQTGPDDEVHD